jgi:tripartite-type tricarboxylate transporter receptor subunit TctC
MFVRFSFRAAAIRVIALALATVWLVPRDAGAADDAKYPDRPVRVVVGFSAGSAVDLSARIIGQKLAENLKQPVVTENRAGAGGAVAAQAVAKAAPDGYCFRYRRPTSSCRRSPLHQSTKWRISSE